MGGRAQNLALFLKGPGGKKVPKNLPPPTVLYRNTPPTVLYELGGPDATDTHYLCTSS